MGPGLGMVPENLNSELVWFGEKDRVEEIYYEITTVTGG